MRRSILLAALLGAFLAVTASALAGPPVGGPDVADVVAKLLPSVVNITNISSGHALPGEVQGDLTIAPKGTHVFGSGFIIDPRGYIATNKHVVIGAQYLTVKLHDGSEYAARVVGEANLADMALIKIHADHPFPPITWATGTPPRIGQPVIAIGNPLGIGESVSMGIVSATDRNIGSSRFDHFIQTDAAINQGNSGGVLVNLEGQVIGMNTAIFVPNGASSSGSVGLGFAMPAGDVSLVLGEIMINHRVDLGWTGISAQPVTGWLARAFGLTDVGGALITGIDPKGPAVKAGLRPGDVLTALNGAPVEDPQALARMTGATPAGTVMQVTFVRDRAVHQAELTIAPWPGGAAAYIPPTPGPRHREPLDLGISVAAITPDIRVVLHLEPDQHGVLVIGVKPDSAGAQLGASAGDIVLRAGDHEVDSPAELEAAFVAARKEGADFLPLLVQLKDGQTGWHAVPLFGFK